MTYNIIMTVYYSDGEVSSQTLRDESNPAQRCSRKGRLVALENIASSQILLMLLDVLHEYLSFDNVDERPSLKCQGLTIEDTLIDVNNNLATKSDNQDLSTDKKAYPCKYQQTTASDGKDFVADTDERIRKSAKTSNKCDNVKNCLASLRSDCGPSWIPEGSIAVSMKNVDSSAKETQEKTTCYSAIHGKSRKPSYRDIDNDGCAEKVKTSLSPRCDLMCNLRKRKDSPTGKRTVCKSKCLDDNVQLSVDSAEFFPLLITDRQGLIEIHVSQLQLSSSASKISGEDDLHNLYVYVSWDIWEEKTAHTMAMRCPNLNFNFSSVYRIADLFSFFNNVLLEYLVFRVNVVRRDDSRYTIARARVSIKDILDYPQNKLPYIVPVSSILSRTYGDNFGQLSLWIRLSCNAEMVEVFKEQCGVASLRDIAPQDIPHIQSPVQVDTFEDRKDNDVASVVSTDDRHLRPLIESSKF